MIKQVRWLFIFFLCTSFFSLFSKENAAPILAVEKPKVQDSRSWSSFMMGESFYQGNVKNLSILGGRLVERNWDQKGIAFHLRMETPFVYNYWSLGMELSMDYPDEIAKRFGGVGGSELSLYSGLRLPVDFIPGFFAFNGDLGFGLNGNMKVLPIQDFDGSLIKSGGVALTSRISVGAQYFPIAWFGVVFEYGYRFNYLVYPALYEDGSSALRKRFAIGHPYTLIGLKTIF